MLCRVCVFVTSCRNTSNEREWRTILTESGRLIVEENVTFLIRESGTIDKGGGRGNSPHQKSGGWILLIAHKSHEFTNNLKKLNLPFMENDPYFSPVTGVIYGYTDVPFSKRLTTPGITPLKALVEEEKTSEFYEVIIARYTDPYFKSKPSNCLVFDPCFGSGASALASFNQNRKFIGIEKNQGYFSEAVKRFRSNVRTEIERQVRTSLAIKKKNDSTKEKKIVEKNKKTNKNKNKTTNKKNNKIESIISDEENEIKIEDDENDDGESELQFQSANESSEFEEYDDDPNDEDYQKNTKNIQPTITLNWSCLSCGKFGEKKNQTTSYCCTVCSLYDMKQKEFVAKTIEKHLADFNKLDQQEMNNSFQQNLWKNCPPFLIHHNIPARVGSLVDDDDPNTLSDILSTYDGEKIENLLISESIYWGDNFEVKTSSIPSVIASNDPTKFGVFWKNQQQCEPGIFIADVWYDNIVVGEKATNELRNKIGKELLETDRICLLDLKDHAGIGAVGEVTGRYHGQVAAGCPAGRINSCRGAGKNFEKLKPNVQIVMNPINKFSFRQAAKDCLLTSGLFLVKCINPIKNGEELMWDYYYPGCPENQTKRSDFATPSNSPKQSQNTQSPPYSPSQDVTHVRKSPVKLRQSKLNKKSSSSSSSSSSIRDGSYSSNGSIAKTKSPRRKRKQSATENLTLGTINDHDESEDISNDQVEPKSPSKKIRIESNVSTVPVNTPTRIITRSTKTISTPSPSQTS